MGRSARLVLWRSKFGTAAEYTVVHLKPVVPLPKGVALEQGAWLSIPGITAHRAVHVAGLVKGKTVVVRGGAGAVGACAVQLAHQAGARVIATCRAEADTTNAPTQEVPVWQLVFVNARIFFVGSDDVPAEAKIEATRDINRALEAGWKGLDIGEIVPLDQIARAHELAEHPAKPGRVVVAIT
jgi:NADPH:quinone reductase